jgi:hypothetical protein
MKEKPSTIFVMIPAYRDPVLLDTLKQIFNNADYPERIYVAVGAQYDDEIPMPDLSEFNSKQLRILSIHPENRPGVYRLRHLLNKLYANEDYYLSIDSHTDLEESWDTNLIRILESQKEYKSIIVAEETHENLEEGYYEKLRMGIDDSNEFPRIVMKEWYPAKYDKGSLPEVSYLQAGMFFTRGQFAREIRWGQYWQNDQEEPFLSYETFMLGWTKRLMVGYKIIIHSPKKYYDAVYLTAPASHERHFVDTWDYQMDYLPYVSPRIFQAYLYNTGPFKIVNAIKKPEEWWEHAGLIQQYRRRTAHSGEIF